MKDQWWWIFLWQCLIMNCIWGQRCISSGSCYFSNRPQLELTLHWNWLLAALFYMSFYSPTTAIGGYHDLRVQFGAERRKLGWNIYVLATFSADFDQSDAGWINLKDILARMHFKCPFRPLKTRREIEPIFFSGLTSFFSSCFPRASFYSISPTGLPSYFSELWTLEDSRATS